jgi:superfamily II DNA or RNA helicase
VKTYGSMQLVKGADGLCNWEITCEPHVMIRLKAVITKVAKFKFGTVQLKHSPEVCRDLEWFVERYPLVNKSPKELAEGAENYRKTLERLETIYLPDHQSLSFPLALPARQYQSQAAEVFLARGGLLLADELGLGKSITSLAALTDPRTNPALIVAQSHLPKQWADYAAKFMPLAKTHIISTGNVYPLPPADIYIITYHRLAKWADVLCGFIRAVIFDEVQELRHPGTGKHSAAEAIRRSAPFAMGLSATPIYNYGGEIFNIIEMLLPGALGAPEEFYREWCTGYGKHQVLKDERAFGAYLRDNFMMVRRTRKEVGRELPPVQTVVQTIEHDEAVLDDLDSVATELAHRILMTSTSFHEKGEAAREFDMKLRQATGIAKAPFVAAFVKMLVESGEPVVVTGWHRAVYEVWKERMGLPISMFTGTETPKEKQREVDRFLSGETKVFIMSLRSGAGLDGLQERCSTIVHGELDWSPGVHEQCRGRLYRDGQAQGVMEYFLVSDGGSDPIVSDVLGLKKAQVRGLLEPGASGLELQADAGARVKKLAEEYLKRKKDGRSLQIENLTLEIVH